MPSDSKSWSYDSDMPALDGKVIFITGGTSGLGALTVERLVAKSPAQIYFTGRNTAAATALIDKAQGIAPAVKLTFVPMDQSDLTSVSQELARGFTSDRLDLLICNAGVLAQPPGTAKDGFETHFTINHLAHALIIRNLLPTLTRTADTTGDARIVLLSSLAAHGHPRGGIAFDSLRTPQSFWVGGPWQRYGQSKLANILYAAELARRHPGITSVSIHPGIIQTTMVNESRFQDRLFLNLLTLWQPDTPEQGIRNTLWAASVAKSEVENGAFYTPVGVNAQRARDRYMASEEIAKKLWEVTEEALQRF